MAILNIQRTNEYNNRFRKFEIFLDGQKIGTIDNGETKQFTIENGIHSLMAKIDWCCSPEITIDLNKNDIKNLKVGGFKNGNWIMPIVGILIIIHFILNYFFDFYYIIFLVIPAFLLLIYYITIGRNKYLTLVEIEKQ